MNSINNYLIRDANNYLLDNKKRKVYLKDSSKITENNFENKFNNSKENESVAVKKTFKNIDVEPEKNITETFVNSKGERIMAIKVNSGMIQYIKIGQVGNDEQNKNVSETEIKQNKNISHNENIQNQVSNSQLGFISQQALDNN